MASSDVDAMTKVGRGNPVTDMMRQYWIPAGQSSELEAGGAPVRVLLLGERLLAFREPNGKVGIIDHMCPHRGASLFFGRNEDGGMRCAYHGWKFDREGNCVDIPNLPASRPCPKIQTTAYRVEEANGMFWVYMGDREVPPPLPIFAHHEVQGVFMSRECNWLQSLEGDIDTSHVGFLHMGGMELADLPEDHPSRIRLIERAPEFEVVRTPWGNMSGAYRDCGDEGKFWGLAHYLFPFWTITANDMPLGPPWIARAWVPMDDTHTMTITIVDPNWQLPPGLPDRDGNIIPGTSFDFGTPVPNSTDWYGRWRIAENQHNDYNMDRRLQKISNLVGIECIVPQDQAITESQGPIQDRSKEHLISSDEMIVRTRRLIQSTAKDWAEKTVVPPGVDNPESFYGARGGVLPAESKDDFFGVFTAASERTATFKSAYEKAEKAVEPVA